MKAVIPSQCALFAKAKSRGVGIRFSLQMPWSTDCHTSDVGHWFAMTGSKGNSPGESRGSFLSFSYSTVTDLARFFGLSMSQPLAFAT